MAAGKVLGIKNLELSDSADDRLTVQDYAETIFSTYNRKFDDLRPPPKDSKDRVEIYSVDDLDLSHVPVEDRETIRVMLRRHEVMWTGKLGVKDTPYHRIEIPDITLPFIQRAYRAVPRYLLIEAEYIYRHLRDGIIRPFRSEVASQVVLGTKADVSMIFCIDYCLLNELAKNTPTLYHVWIIVSTYLIMPMFFGTLCKLEILSSADLALRYAQDIFHNPSGSLRVYQYAFWSYELSRDHPKDGGYYII